MPEPIHLCSLEDLDETDALGRSLKVGDSQFNLILVLDRHSLW
ncbi:hypothetical protein SAMN04515647_0711 [Cohaesibacter sp. ES.047]|nr:hypothetical protein SAMN04515647_0711 [Cohaesibacter sp. ES.047]